MKLDELKLWVSPLTNKIYAGFTDKSGTTATSKVEITEMAVSTVMQHLDLEQAGYECEAGRLEFFPAELPNRK
ncbi:hypothetical protein HSX37_16320|uniref:Uncharacterized protein n=1 Tax=Dendrosporobacter quercicolus TaxID=146817 RepID=A0A1G9ZVE3_9FIRM|nr:hypothetical protein [Dendrosporobacter quercicolus]NSL49602.1 hypothetical protein [Dendrosporobacter quercicolus DSM 1736]SDN24496.1 hypothetical protein SAMN04488502_11558 [Dendrosporobacter quercicolus]